METKEAIKVSNEKSRQADSIGDASNTQNFKTNRSFGQGSDEFLMAGRSLSKRDAGDRESTIKYALQQFAESLHEQCERVR